MLVYQGVNGFVQKWGIQKTQTAVGVLLRTDHNIMMQCVSKLN